jgi:hypothetical protein
MQRVRASLIAHPLHERFKENRSTQIVVNVGVAKLRFIGLIRTVSKKVN